MRNYNDQKGSHGLTPITALTVFSTTFPLAYSIANMCSVQVHNRTMCLGTFALDVALTGSSAGIHMVFALTSGLN